MANIEDYLDWRADIPFEVDPFNEVDSLVLCELVYTAFDDIVPGPSVGLKEKISIEDACSLFFAKYTKEELLAKNNLTKVAPFLMEKMANSARYGGMMLAGFVNHIDAESFIQFSVCTFYLTDGTIFVAFRGTDDSLIGWKEDFNMCYSTGTGGQLRAVEYLNDNFSTTMRPLRIGGHSKGGNLAVYGSAFCKSHIKDSIIEIYNHDGPGFIHEIVDTYEYNSIVGKVRKFVPEESIIGLLMYTKAQIEIIESNAKGINQHDPMSWQVVGNRFKTKEKLAESAVLTDEILKKAAGKFDYEARQVFGDIFFGSMQAAGATKLSQIMSNKGRAVAIFTKEIQNLSPEDQALVVDVIASFVASGSDSIMNSLLSKLSKNPIVRKRE